MYYLFMFNEMNINFIKKLYVYKYFDHVDLSEFS